MEALEKSLENEINFLDFHFSRTISIQALIDFIRTLDYIYIAQYPDKEKWDLYIDYGFPIILKKAFEKLELDAHHIPFNHITQHNIDYCFNNLKYYGQYRSAQRFYQMVCLNLINVPNVIGENVYEFEFDIYTAMADSYEMLMIKNHFKLAHKVNAKKVYQLNTQQKKIEKQFQKKIYRTAHGLIGYHTSPEIDAFYSQRGYIHMITSQIYDDFADDFEFGGIPYKNYLNVIQELMGVTFKHLYACTYFVRNNNINIANILSTCYYLEEILDQYADYLDIPIEEIRQIFNLLTVSKQNITPYLKADKSFSPPFIKIGEKHVVRSVKGCLHQPISFLLKSLSENYPAEYSKGLRQREVIFRKEFYGLFNDDRIIKVDKEVRIKLKDAGIETDIDAILFDTKTKTLALIQLKWQDRYSTDLKERNSKADNFYSKANEWIEKVIRWKELVNQKQILNAVGIKEYKSFNECYIFVIGRYNTTFIEKVSDNRATWCSWYQIMNFSWGIKNEMVNPIEDFKSTIELHSPLKFTTEIPDEEMDLCTFKINFKQRKKL